MKLRMHRLTVGAALGLWLSLGPAARAADALVDMDKMTFAPAELSITAGTNVVFRNSDRIAHEVVVRDGDPFDLKLQNPGESTSHVFGKPGVYVVRCDIHPRMNMIIKVQ